ncbi:MAG: TetM/TetW/TetO/TetS family tetracycline resistance ribosomal protection protein [Ruminococcus sp.]|nr:TetM/TetW/TetO/TetS family tetracycline resistance ribosomal protection protein [Ruminococcus sp.]
MKTACETDKRETENKIEKKKKTVIGILAHVDAGKTTLAESLLYISGSIRRAGRVDHGDTFLDTDAQERTRGITIFSKQAQISWKDTDITLLDTPGHVDFSAEMERTLQILDYAVLVISAPDGVQEHVVTLWKLLSRYDIPAFLFINKMDMPESDRQGLLRELQERLGSGCIDFSGEKEAEETRERQDFLENIAVCDERLLNNYLEGGGIAKEEIKKLIAERKVFPCYFGSALKMTGIEEFLDGVAEYTRPVEYPQKFAARVYKIGRDGAGNRLTYMKITGGCLQVKQTLVSREGTWEEKVDQIRVYSGLRYQTVQEAQAGEVCAVTGLTRTFSGEGLGEETESAAPLLAPVMTYRILLPEECDVHGMYKNLCQLAEEEPQLHVVWKEQVGEIHVQLMGEVQIEVLKNLIEERFGAAVGFDAGSIVYKETIKTPAEGAGHFEPLRHYAEVHLLLEPGEPGSGLVFDTACSTDMLDKNWQRLVLTHLEEKEHIGILAGAPLTDMKITLMAGRAHLKHTEGGDFRQATYRALRQGLHRAECVLLEPVYEFRLEVPSSMIGRAMSDIQAMHGAFEGPTVDGDLSILTGKAPVSTMWGYQTQVLSYSGGRGRFFCSLKGYEPCHNTEEVLAKIGYDEERDLDNPSSSVFCAHGAGFIVKWDEAENYMHVESLGRGVQAEGSGTAEVDKAAGGSMQAGEIDRTGQQMQTGQGGNVQDESAQAAKQEPGRPRQSKIATSLSADKELEEIFNRTYGGRNAAEDEITTRKKWGSPRESRQTKYDTVVTKTDTSVTKSADKAPPKEYLLVDGYNILFAWEELSELAKSNLDGARGKLMDILSNYQGYRKMTLILVFDAYKVKGNPGSIQNYHNIHVVYTKEAETADQYIEKATHEMAKKHHVTVATSDGLEQLIIMGQGARRLSARELKEDIMSTSQELRELFLNKKTHNKQYLFDNLPEELAAHLEEVRLGRKDF